MLITCSGCKSQMRAPDTLAGKKVKCPKCATIMVVPAAEPPSVPAPPPPPPEPITLEPLPAPPPSPEPITVEPLPSDAAATGFSAEPITVEPLPSPPTDAGGTEVTASPPRGRFEDQDEPRGRFEDLDQPSRGPRRDRFGEDMDIRRPGEGAGPVDQRAMTSMVLGIVGLGFGTVGCLCCGAFGAGIGLICGVLALIFGIKGKSRGSEVYANTGIYCGIAAIAIGLIGAAIGIAVIVMQIQMGNLR